MRAAPHTHGLSGLNQVSASITTVFIHSSGQGAYTVSTVTVDVASIRLIFGESLTHCPVKMARRLKKASVKKSPWFLARIP